MQKNLLLLGVFTGLLFSCQSPETSSNEPDKKETVEKKIVKFLSPEEQLIADMIDAIGGLDKFKSLRDVQYDYTYKSSSGYESTTIEKYIFKNELSYGKDLHFSNEDYPDTTNVLEEWYDGTSAWVKINGELTTDSSLIDGALFSRKTNYYWFAMMFKLLDPGMMYELKERKEIDGISYHVVSASFEDGIGEVKDTYELYINPDTKLVDQFLFTVMAFDRTEPLLMKVQYEEIQGLKIPTYRKFTAADWDGNILKDKWTEEISKNVKFNNQFDVTFFSN